MKKHFPILLLLACAAIFVGTFYLLLSDRFKSGDVYPASSSLRSDPLGTMVFFEGLQRLPGVRVERDHSFNNQLPAGTQTTYLHLAAHSYDWKNMPTELHRTIDRFLLEGGRLVITLAPEYERRRSLEKAGKDEEEEKKKANNEEKPDRDTVDLGKTWGFEFSKTPMSAKDNFASNVSGLPLPSKLKWNGDVVLESPGSSWRIIYQNENGPVLAERKRGKGSIVVATDSYFVSNEAMVGDRHPELLAWLVGSSNHIVFDEAHLGIVQTPGLSTLAYKYGLHGTIIALLVLAALFIWKDSSPLAPPLTEGHKFDQTLMGRSTGAGFVSLLKRNIPSNQVLDVCLAEWRKTFAHGSRLTPGEKAAVEEISQAENSLPPRERNPLAAYRKICAALKRHSSKPTA